MSFSVNTNSNALAALETLNLTQQALTATQKQVSTGLRVASAADDASTFAIAQGQRGDIAGFQSISNSLSLGSATLNVALQGAQTISNTLNEIKGKIVSAAGSDAGRNAIQNDITAFISQINSVAQAAQFNGVNLISSNSTNENVLSSLNRVGSTVTAASITVNAQHLDAASLGLTGLNVAGTGCPAGYHRQHQLHRSRHLLAGCGRRDDHLRVPTSPSTIDPDPRPTSRSRSAPASAARSPT